MNETPPSQITFEEWDRWIVGDGTDEPYGGPYLPGQLWWPLSASINEWEFEFHKLMLCDRVRMKKYREAIYAVIGARANGPVTRDKILRVLDIGCGTGVLMRLAADAWTNLKKEVRTRWDGIRIYGVERNRMVAVTANNFLSQICAPAHMATNTSPRRRLLWNFDPENSDRLETIAERALVVLVCRSDELPSKLREWADILDGFDVLDLFKGRPHKEKNGPNDEGQSAQGLDQTTEKLSRAKIFDVIMTETIGGIADDEDIVRILDNGARALARKDCAFVPSAVESYVTPVLMPHGATHPIAILPPLPAHRKHVNDNGKGYWTINTMVYDLTAINDARNTIWDTVVADEWTHNGSNRLVRKWTFGIEASVTPHTPCNPRLSYSTALTFPISDAFASRSFVGFKGWFVATLANNIKLSTAPAGALSGKDRATCDCWKHRFLPIDQPMVMSKGNSIELVLSRSDDHDLAGYI